MATKSSIELKPSSEVVLRILASEAFCTPEEIIEKLLMEELKRRGEDGMTRLGKDYLRKFSTGCDVG